MKKIILSAIMVASISLSSQTDNSLARVAKNNNKCVFNHNEPINEYDVAFTFINLIPECKTEKEAETITITNANQEAGNQGKLYDAIIIGDNERDIAIVWKDKSKDNAIARVSKVEGRYVFINCEPLTNYEMVSKYNVEGAGQQLLLGTCPTRVEKISKIIKKSEKSKLSYDAVIYGVSENDLVIKFK
jgi:hypothetical protein